MVGIKKIKVLSKKLIYFKFSNGSEKTIDFAVFIGKDKLSQPLNDSSYFKKVQLYDNGRGLFWPNGFDFCTDFLLEYKPNQKEEFAGKK